MSVLETLIDLVCTVQGSTAVDSSLIGWFVGQCEMIHNQLRRANYPAGQLPTNIGAPSPTVPPCSLLPGTILSVYLNSCFIGRDCTLIPAF